MKKMSRRIFLNMYIITIIVLVSSTLLTVGVIYNSLSKQNISMLEDELYSVENGVNINGDKFLETLKTKHRITLIDNDGTVLFDNVKNAQSMENHSGREEIEEAKKSGYGYSERYSDTMSKTTINLAVRLDNKKILRISEMWSSVWELLLKSFVPMLAVLVVAVILAIALAYRMSKLITKPINELNLAYPKKDKVYEELEPLVDKINEQNEQIKEQMEELRIQYEKQDNMRRDFTANVSHELKTPLTSISGFAELIQNGWVKEEDIPRFAGKIYDESQRLIVLVGDIIKLSQLDGSDMSVKMEPIDLYETSQAVMSHLEAAAEKNNVKMHLEGSRMIITGAEQIIEEMIFNLVDNAVKYSKDGGNVIVSIGKVNDRVQLSVSDDGIGIPEEDLERIFERFYRVDKSHSKEIGGTGLGLSIVKHGALFHNALLSIHSELNVGTTITITF